MSSTTKVDAKLVANHMIKTIASLLDNNESVYVGLNSYIPFLAVAVAQIAQRKNLRFFSVADCHNPSMENFSLTYSTGDAALANLGTVFITIEAFDLVQKGMIDVMFLGPLQIDIETNFNLSVIGSYEKPKVRLTGGAASAFIAPLVKKLVLWNVKHNKRSFVPKVDFVTASAKYSKNEVWVCTNLCLLRFDRARGSWALEALHPWSSIEDVTANTGFTFVYDKVKTTSSPTEKENDIVSRLDPKDLRLTAFY